MMEEIDQQFQPNYFLVWMVAFILSIAEAFFVAILEDFLPSSVLIIIPATVISAVFISLTRLKLIAKKNRFIKKIIFFRIPIYQCCIGGSSWQSYGHSSINADDGTYSHHVTVSVRSKENNYIRALGHFLAIIYNVDFIPIQNENRTNQSTQCR